MHKLPPQARPIQFVIETVAADFGLTFDDVVGSVNIEPVLTVRWLAVRLARDLVENAYSRTGSSGAYTSYNRLGAVFRRHHTTLIPAYNKMGDRLRDHPWLRARYDRLRSELEVALRPQIELASANDEEQKERATETA